jgi:ferric-dicitrate binding protein FerR (iron transport regulator)
LNDRDLHIKKLTPAEEDFFAKVEPDFEISAADVLSNMMDNIDNETSKTISRKLNFKVYYPVAAIIIVLLAVGAIMRFYTENLQSARGEHLVFSLPDGSKVSLNAQSSLKYHPYWWWNKRELKLDGEAFFEVSKGEKFTVVSRLGKTVVLGTSFNIFSRNDKYKVDCYSGKVKVVSNKNKEVILTPSYSAEIQNDGNVKLKKFEGNKQANAWINKMFSFTSVPLTEVLMEVERQFNIIIEADIPADLIYTGNFSADISIDETLQLLCKPFDLKVQKINEGVYRLK